MQYGCVNSMTISACRNRSEIRSVIEALNTIQANCDRLIA